MKEATAAELVEQGLACAGADEALAIARRLEKGRRFGHARVVLEHAAGLADRSQPPDAKRREVAAEQAYCMFKDPDLPLGPRLDEAVELLERAGLGSGTDDPRLLGLAGEVWTRKWEAGAQIRHLERAMGYHRRGYTPGGGPESGYCGIRAALLLDVLASVESAEAACAGRPSEVAEKRRLDAAEIRAEIVRDGEAWTADGGDDADGSRFWAFVTRAEASFGLGRYREAADLLAEARGADADPLSADLRSTAEHLAALLRFGPGAKPGEPDREGRDVLEGFLAGCSAGALAAYRGKVGLALSGGGFRAAFFHIGVLAKLAELDVLRHVEVISCVSGGSLVGAHWYLQVRRLLEQPPPGGITRESYIELVRETATAFVEGAERNARMRAIGALWTNLRGIFDVEVTRTTRLGELYERDLYARVADDETGDRFISKLYVYPEGEDGPDDPEPFNPRADNWRRAHKAPIVVLNATTLNTGHNWQFTASWMGEPASGLIEDVDPAERLRRVPYASAPPRYRQLRLGSAVAASACVPGLFEPLTMTDLYRADRDERDRDRGGWTVRLVDGGVHDNEGTASLLTEDCGVMIVSDASGQMGSQRRPGGGIPSVPLRSMAILKARVREAQWRELEARDRAEALHGLAYVHLREELDSPAVTWDGARRWEPLDDVPPESSASDTTSYGVAKELQDLLASIRTDLDSFSEIEAHALMTSGYLMIERRFQERPVADFATGSPREQWDFLAAEDALAGAAPAAQQKHFAKVLRTGRDKWFKPWRLSLALKLLSPVVVPLLLAVALALGAVGLAVGAVLGSAAALFKLVVLALGRAMPSANLPGRKTSIPAAVQRILLGSLLCTAGTWIGWAYVLVLDRFYLSAGRMRKLDPDGG
ncbi:MAG TPA: patatin-like phospholipase family protein [Thermoleophilaceae bacterium]